MARGLSPANRDEIMQRFFGTPDGTEVLDATQPSDKKKQPLAGVDGSCGSITHGPPENDAPL